MSSREIPGATSSQWVHCSLQFVRGVVKPVFSYFCFFLGSYRSEDIKVQNPLGCFSLYKLLVSQTQNLCQIWFLTGLVFSCDLKRLICLNLLTLYCCRAEVLTAVASPLHCPASLQLLCIWTLKNSSPYKTVISFNVFRNV